MGANEWGTPPEGWAGAMPEPIRYRRPCAAMFTKGELYRVTTAETDTGPEQVLVGECIGVYPENILLRTAEQPPSQHWMITYQGMQTASPVPVV